MLGFPIRKSWDQRLFAPPPSLSQLITSFFASQSLGIHRSLLFAFFILFARTCISDNACVVSTNTQRLLRLLYRKSVALLLFLSFFQYIKDRFWVDSWQFIIVSSLSHDNPLNLLFDSVSPLRNRTSFFSYSQKNSTRLLSFGGE